MGTFDYSLDFNKEEIGEERKVSMADDDLEMMKKKYAMHKDSDEENLFLIYYDNFIDPLLEKIEDESQEDFFYSLNKSQRTLYLFAIMFSEIAEGGVFFIFWHLPEFCDAIKILLEHSKMPYLVSEYETAFNTFIKNQDKYLAAQNKVMALIEGKDEIPDEVFQMYDEIRDEILGDTRLPFDEFFDSEENRLKFYADIGNFVTNNIDDFLE